MTFNIVFSFEWWLNFRDGISKSCLYFIPSFNCTYSRNKFTRGGERVAHVPHPLFLQSLVFFCNHFEELRTVLFKVELIINNAPLTYAYPNTIKTCLTPNHLLFGRQLLYSSNTTSTVVRNLTVLSSTTDQ